MPKKPNATPAERRQHPKPDPAKLYRQPRLTTMIGQERRQDWLAQLLEVQYQQRVWYAVVAVCLAMNIFLLILAFWGWRLNA